MKFLQARVLIIGLIALSLVPPQSVDGQGGVKGGRLQVDGKTGGPYIPGPSNRYAASPGVKGRALVAQPNPQPYEASPGVKGRTIEAAPMPYYATPGKLANSTNETN